MKELKLCPFCGSEAKISLIGKSYINRGYVVRCVLCNAQSKPIWTDDFTKHHSQELERLWNRRSNDEEEEV